MDGTILGKKYNLMNGNGGGGANIAPTFSETSQYIYGDLVFYEGQLYRFEVEEHEPGPWNPEEVMGTSIDENLVMLPGDGIKRTMHEFSVKLKSDGGLHFDQNGAIYADHLPDYRLTEHNTKQQWIDGRDIYVKTFNAGALPSNGNVVISNDISDFGAVINVETTGISNDGYSFANDGLVLSNASAASFVFRVTFDATGYNGYVTVYYVKSTTATKKKSNK